MNVFVIQDHKNHILGVFQEYEKALSALIKAEKLFTEKEQTYSVESLIKTGTKVIKFDDGNSYTIKMFQTK